MGAQVQIQLVPLSRPFCPKAGRPESIPGHVPLPDGPVGESAGP